MWDTVLVSWRHGQRWLVIVAGLACATIVVGLVLIALTLTGVLGGSSVTNEVYQTGTFTKTTMTCPGQKETLGDTCLLPVHLSGSTRIQVTWSGSPLIALGLRDSRGRDVGPQVTGDHGTAVLTASKLTAGTYQLRVVDVTPPDQPLRYTIAISTG
jgi:hypothetical protein